jgi:uncharacterized protein
MNLQSHALVESLKQHTPDLRLVILFGSFASGHQRDDSDIDLAIAALRPLDPTKLFDIKMTLQEASGRTVDLVDLNNADVSIVLKNEAIIFGKLLFAADETVFSEIEAPIRREAEDFLFRRRDLETHLAERMRAYATTR